MKFSSDYSLLNSLKILQLLSVDVCFPYKINLWKKSNVNNNLLICARKYVFLKTILQRQYCFSYFLAPWNVHFFVNEMLSHGFERFICIRPWWHTCPLLRNAPECTVSRSFVHWCVSTAHIRLLSTFQQNQNMIISTPVPPGGNVCRPPEPAADAYTCRSFKKLFATVLQREQTTAIEPGQFAITRISPRNCATSSSRPRQMTSMRRTNKPERSSSRWVRRRRKKNRFIEK